jgi:hypothetical protein
MTKTIVTSHFDRLGKEIVIDSCVVFPQSNMLRVGKVIKLNPKMIGIQPISKHGGKCNKYPLDCVVVNDSDVSMAILKGDL